MLFFRLSFFFTLTCIKIAFLNVNGQPTSCADASAILIPYDVITLNDANDEPPIVDTSNVDSSVRSYFSGWSGMTKETMKPGSLVLGGYDASIISNDSRFINIPFSGDSACPYALQISGMTFLGSDLDWAPTTEGSLGWLRACIYPGEYMSTLPTALWYQILRNLRKSPPESYDRWNQPYEKFMINQDYLDTELKARGLTQIDIGMSWKLEGLGTGTNLSIPIQRLFQSDRVYQNATAPINDATVMAATMQFAPDSSSLDIRLGVTFLSSNYLVVNTHNGTFSIAPVKQSASPDEQSILVPIVNSQECTDFVPVFSRPEPVPSPPPQPKGLAVSEIVGIVLGAFAVSGLLASALVLCYRRPSAPLIPQAPSPSIAEKDGIYSAIYQLEAKGAPQESGGEEIYHLNDHFAPGTRRSAPSFYEMP